LDAEFASFSFLDCGEAIGATGLLELCNLAKAIQPNFQTETETDE